ncbi:MAG: hypothetical protein ETSY2_50100, partial [Candidatus Entotheonella gemina]
MPVALAIEPVTATIDVGQTQPFTARVTLSDGSNQEVTNQATWTSSNDNIATINAQGLATGISLGTVQINAQFAGFTASANLTVEGPPDPVPVSLAIEPVTATINVGQTQSFTARVTLSDGSNQEVTNQTIWTSSNDNVVTIDAQGLATGIGDGTVQITAQFAEFSVTATLMVEALPDPVVVSLAIEPMTATIDVDQTQLFTARAILSDGSTQEVTNQATWTSSNDNVATIDTQGLATGIRAGTVQINAQLTEFMATATLIVQEPPDPVPVALAIEPETATINVGQTQSFTLAIV